MAHQQIVVVGRGDWTTGEWIISLPLEFEWTRRRDGRGFYMEDSRTCPRCSCEPATPAAEKMWNRWPEAAVVPSRPTEKLVCGRGHPQPGKPTRVQVPSRTGWEVAIDVAPCPVCEAMPRRAARLEAYLAAGDVRGVLRPRRISPRAAAAVPTPEEVIECLLGLRGQRAETFWDIEAVRAFLDGEALHPPGSHAEEMLAASVAAAGLAPGSPEAEAHCRAIGEAAAEVDSRCAGTRRGE